VRALIGFPALALLASTAGAAADFTDFVLDNGLRVVLSERRGSGLFTSTVFVRAGAMRESPEMSGAAHYLEHLLFNGTTSRTQEQLYADVDRLGAYNNATTQKDYVIYMLMAGAESMREALEIQADMLFHSTLPPEKFEKEKGILVAELAKDMEGPSYALEQALAGALHGGTPYARPVLGTYESIEAMERDAIYGYYRRYYVPANMVLLVMGDFDADAMRAAIGETFGAAPAGERPAEPARLPEPARSRIVYAPAEAGHRAITIRLPAPMPGDADFEALELLADILGRGEGSRLKRALDVEPKLAVNEIGAGITLVGGRAFLDVDVELDRANDPEPVIRRLAGELARLAREEVSAAELEAARVAKRTEEVQLLQQIHYYGLMLGQLVVNAPPGYLATRMERYRGLTVAALREVAERRFSTPAVRVAAAGPELRERDDAIRPEEVGFAPPAFELPPVPAAAEGSPAGTKAPPRATGAEPAKFLTLGSGMRVVLVCDPTSELLAAHLLACGRSYREPAGKSGIADLIHRAMWKGAGAWDEAELAGRLNAIGATIKSNDSPMIPYDDYYTTQEFSFVRLEVLEDYYREALGLLGAVVTRPLFEEPAIEEAKAEMLRLIAQEGESAHSRARLAYRRILFPDSARAGGAMPVLGTEASIGSITRDDMVAFHRRYFAPQNLVLAVVTGLRDDVVISEIERAFDFSAWSGVDPVPAWTVETAQPRVAAAPEVARIEKGGPQAWITMGYAFDFDREDEAPLEIAGEILADRMSFQLREREGLAYTIGASISSWGERGLLTASMGTQRENVAAAVAGIAAQIDSMAVVDLAPEDVERVVNATVGRIRMRRVTRIGQAYQLCMDVLRGRTEPSFAREVAALRAVTPDDVKRVTRQHVHSGRAHRVIVE
jgi:predicted Zn-dependent peptidase